MITKAEELVSRTIGDYHLLKMLGKGGMSTVFLAQHVEDAQEKVALKVLASSAVEAPEELPSFQARFLREAEATQKMHHEHILPVWDFGSAGNIFYMVMPLITGGALSEKLANEQWPMPLEEVAEYLNQLASAIDYAHQHGVIHRDIKPSNVLIDEQGHAYLVDFGILHLFDSGPYAIEDAPTRLTSTGKLYGTTAYMAPERFKGEQAEPANDIYSFGVMAYLLVTGQLPFKADTPILMGMKHLNEMPPPPRSLRPDLSEPAEAAILKALAKRPADRFTSAAAFAAAFDAGIKGQWVEGLLPLPSMAPPTPDNAAVKQETLEDVVPVPEDPNPLVLSSALASSLADLPVADQPRRTRPAPGVPPRARSQNLPIVLLWGAVVLVAVVFLLLLVPELPQVLSLSPRPTPTPTATTPTTPTTPSGTSSGSSGASGAAVPTPTSAGVSGPPPTATPTLASLPTPTPGAAPKVTPTPATTPQPTPAASPPPPVGVTPPASQPTPPGVSPPPPPAQTPTPVP